MHLTKRQSENKIFGQSIIALFSLQYMLFQVFGGLKKTHSFGTDLTWLSKVCSKREGEICY